jgi:hypothetical protein
VHSLKFIRQFYMEYPRLGIGYALRSQFETSTAAASSGIHHATRDEFSGAGRISDAEPRESTTEALPGAKPIRHAVRGELGAGSAAPETLYALRKESRRPLVGTSGSTRGRAGHG